MVEMYSYLKSLFLCSLAKFVQLMALYLSLSLSLSLSLFSLSLSLSLSLSFCLSLSLSLSLFLSFSGQIRMPVDHQLELSVDNDLHCSSPVVRKAVLLDEVHVGAVSLLSWWIIVWMRRISRWFAVNMVGADVVGVVGLPKFPRTSAEFPPSAAAIHVPASVISQCQVGSEKNHLPRPSLCRFVHSITQQDVTIPKLYSGNNFSKKLGLISEERNTTLWQGRLCRRKSMQGRRPTSFLAYQRLGRG